MNPFYDFKGQVALVTELRKAWAWRRRACSPRAAPPSCWRISTAGSPRERLSESSSKGGVACDVADEAQAAAIVDRAVAEYRQLDMAFNNAGIQVPPSEAADEPIESFERVTAVNQRGVWACMKHLL
jgi:NAD(P)-dependent dehydrogenase (short-subunit alcohol dehydrogenase family)